MWAASSIAAMFGTFGNLGNFSVDPDGSLAHSGKSFENRRIMAGDDESGRCGQTFHAVLGGQV